MLQLINYIHQSIGWDQKGQFQTQQGQRPNLFQGMEFTSESLGLVSDWCPAVSKQTKAGAWLWGHLSSACCLHAPPSSAPVLPGVQPCSNQLFPGVALGVSVRICCPVNFLPLET